MLDPIVNNSANCQYFLVKNISRVTVPFQSTVLSNSAVRALTVDSSLRKLRFLPATLDASPGTVADVHPTISAHFSTACTSFCHFLIKPYAAAAQLFVIVLSAAAGPARGLLDTRPDGAEETHSGTVDTHRLAIKD